MVAKRKKKANPPGSNREGGYNGGGDGRKSGIRPFIGGGGGGANYIPQIDDISISINISGLLSPSNSYQKQEIEINSDNLECTFTISLNNNELNDINHVSTLDNKKFSFRKHNRSR